MISRMISTSVYVLNLEHALSFYQEKLGFRIHTEIQILPGRRLVSVFLPEAPKQQFLLIPIEEGILFNRKQVKQMRQLIKEKIFSAGVFVCADLPSTCSELKARGVQFLMDPGEGFLSQYEAAFVDDSGNWYRLTQDDSAC